MNKPMLCPDGYFKEVYEYNDNQQAISLSYLGVNGKSIDCKDGYSKIELTYNKDGEMESRKYTNASGRILLTQKWNGKEWVNSSPEPISRNWRECNLNSVWFLFLLNHNKYNFFFLDLQMLLKVVFGCVQGRRRMSRLYTLAHIRELPFLCV